MKHKIDVYSVKDLMSATFIAYNGIKFADDYDSSTKSWIFENPDECKKLDLQLRNGDAEVEVIKYESTRRTLLGMVRDQKSKNGQW